MKPGSKIIALALVAISGTLLILTSQIVQNLEKQKRGLKKQIEMENRKIRFLKAEWAYLNRPSRLEKEIEKRGLGIAPDQTGGVIAAGQDVPEPVKPVMPASKPGQKDTGQKSKNEGAEEMMAGDSIEIYRAKAVQNALGNKEMEEKDMPLVAPASGDRPYHKGDIGDMKTELNKVEEPAGQDGWQSEQFQRLLDGLEHKERAP